MPDYDVVLYQKLTIKKLMTYAADHIGEWNTMYKSYIMSEWDRLFNGKKYDDSKILMLTNNPDFMPPFWGELSNIDIPRIKYEQKKEQEYLKMGSSDADRVKESLDFQGTMSKNRDDIESKIFINDINCKFTDIDLRGAFLWHISLNNAYIMGGCFQGAILNGAELIDTKFTLTNLEGADLFNVQCERTIFTKCNLKKSRFEECRVDGYTRFYDNQIDRYTDFSGVGLSECRLYPEFKTALENNIRWKSWKRWYAKEKLYLWHNKLAIVDRLKKQNDEKKEVKKEKKICIYYWKFVKFIENIFINVPVRIFWWASDYGSSTKRVIGVFFVWNFFWALIYLFILPNLSDLIPVLVNTTLLLGPLLAFGSISLLDGLILACVYTTTLSGPLLGWVHTLIQSTPILNGTNITVLPTQEIVPAVLQTNLMMFSITDVTTKDLNCLALFCVTLHIVIGYFILAALITRLGIMFQNLGP